MEETGGPRRQQRYAGVKAQRTMTQDSHPPAWDCDLSKKQPFSVLALICGGLSVQQLSTVC